VFTPSYSAHSGLVAGSGGLQVRNFTQSDWHFGPLSADAAGGRYDGGAMKSFLLCALLMVGGIAAGAAGGADLNQVHTVYLLPMANGFDQFLASQLTAQGVFRVTTDPARADAFFTDRIGTDFEDRLSDLLPETPKKEAAEPKPAAAPAGNPQDTVAAFADAAGAPPAAGRGLGRGKGNVYLVARESRLVIWSTFARPKDTRPKHLDGLAGKLAGSLKREMAGNPKP